MAEKVLKNQNYQDQSLEQILSNIKEVIINHSPNMDVLELTERIYETQKTNNAKENVSFLTHLQKKNSQHSLKAKTYEPEPVLAEERTSVNTDRLINFKTATESMKAFKNFLKAKEKHEVEKIALRSGLTLEELIIELLKPELSVWLNKNLPDIVNNIVQREIKKLIPKDE